MSIEHDAVADAHEEGWWLGYEEGRTEAETRDLSFDELTDRLKAAEADASHFQNEYTHACAVIDRVEALAEWWEAMHAAHDRRAHDQGDVEQAWIAADYQCKAAALRAALAEEQS